MDQNLALIDHFQLRFLGSTIPWHQMNGIRNILIHEYFGVDTETVWHSAKKHLPPLKNQLKEIILENAVENDL